MRPTPKCAQPKPQCARPAPRNTATAAPRSRLHARARPRGDKSRGDKAGSPQVPQVQPGRSRQEDKSRFAARQTERRAQKRKDFASKRSQRVEAQETGLPSKNRTGPEGGRRGRLFSRALAPLPLARGPRACRTPLGTRLLRPPRSSVVASPATPAPRTRGHRRAALALQPERLVIKIAPSASIRTSTGAAAGRVGSSRVGSSIRTSTGAAATASAICSAVGWSPASLAHALGTSTACTAPRAQPRPTCSSGTTPTGVRTARLGVGLRARPDRGAHARLHDCLHASASSQSA